MNNLIQPNYNFSNNIKKQKIKKNKHKKVTKKKYLDQVIDKSFIDTYFDTKKKLK